MIIEWRGCFLYTLDQIAIPITVCTFTIYKKCKWFNEPFLFKPYVLVYCEVAYSCQDSNQGPNRNNPKIKLIFHLLSFFFFLVGLSPQIGVVVSLYPKLEMWVRGYKGQKRWRLKCCRVLDNGERWGDGDAVRDEIPGVILFWNKHFSCGCPFPSPFPICFPFLEAMFKPNIPYSH